MGSTTKVVFSHKLAAKADVAPTVLKLMMAVNDISLANAATHEWASTEDSKKSPRQIGAMLYFGRMQMAHVFEAMEIIKEIKKRPVLLKSVDQCGTTTRAMYDRIAGYLDSDEYRRLLRLRNNASFHYDGKLAMRALEQLARENPQDNSVYSTGSEPLDWYYELGDKALDLFLVRDVFGISLDENLRTSVKTMLDKLFEVTISFGNFARAYIRHHAS